MVNDGDVKLKQTDRRTDSQRDGQTDNILF